MLSLVVPQKTEENDRERERERERDTHTHRHRETDRDTERYRCIGNVINSELVPDRYRHR